MTKIALIGGSGIKDNPLFKESNWEVCDTGYQTPFGTGLVPYQEADDVIFIPRHGMRDLPEGMPTGIYGPSKSQYAANLIAARMLGARVVIATSAVGSLKQGINVETLVVPDDFVDETGRDDNLFGKDFVVHTQPRPPFSEGLRQVLFNCSNGYFNWTHLGGTCVVIPGDRFGTAAEGRKRAQYADIVGMTICPEAMMALQLDMHYAVACFVVDSDFDARHSQTLAVMQKLSAPDKVPAYITEVVKRARDFQPDKLEQLVGNIIPGDINGTTHPFLQRVAYELIEKYS